MKRTKIKVAIIVVLVLGAFSTLNAANGFENKKNSDAVYILYDSKFEQDLAVSVSPIIPAFALLPNSTGEGLTLSSAYADEMFSRNRSGIYKYGSAVIIEKYKVAELEKQLKKAKLSKDLKSIRVVKRKLAKAKFDLLRDQLHFIVDREALRQDYLLEIKAREQKLADDRAELDKARWKTVKQWITYDDKGLKLTKKFISEKKKDISADKAAIASERALLKAEMKTVDKMMK